MNTDFKPHFATKCYKFTYTVPIKHNLTEIQPRLNPVFTFGVNFGFILSLQERTQSKPKVNQE